MGTSFRTVEYLLQRESIHLFYSTVNLERRFFWDGDRQVKVKRLSRIRTIKHCHGYNENGC